MVAIDDPRCQSFGPMADMEHAFVMWAREDGQTLFPVMILFDRPGISPGEIAAVLAGVAHDPPRSRIVGAVSAHAARPICRLSQSEIHWIALRPALSTTREL